MAITKTAWGTIQTVSAAATDIASKTATVNTTNKYEGLYVWDSTNKRLMRAAGGTDVSAWDCVDGSATVTPT